MVFYNYLGLKERDPQVTYAKKTVSKGQLQRWKLPSIKTGSSVFEGRQQTKEPTTVEFIV